MGEVQSIIFYREHENAFLNKVVGSNVLERDRLTALLNGGSLNFQDQNNADFSIQKDVWNRVLSKIGLQSGANVLFPDETKDKNDGLEPLRRELAKAFGKDIQELVYVINSLLEGMFSPQLKTKTRIRKISVQEEERGPEINIRDVVYQILDKVFEEFPNAKELKVPETDYFARDLWAVELAEYIKPMEDILREMVSDKSKEGLLISGMPDINALMLGWDPESIKILVNTLGKSLRWELAMGRLGKFTAKLVEELQKDSPHRYIQRIIRDDCKNPLSTSMAKRLQKMKQMFNKTEEKILDGDNFLAL